MEKDLQIQKRLQEHLDSALAAHPCDWFVICLQGSQNYGLDDEESDIDTKILTLPSMRELVLNLKSFNHVHVMENDEHCDMKDAREYFKIFRKQNINFVEILFTDYWICNPKYLDIWLELRNKAEELARYNPYAALSCMKGMASEKLHALDHEYPSRMFWIEKFGYDPKQLSHLIRIKYFIKNYINKKSYKECLDTPNKQFLLDIKRNGMGHKDEAIKYAQSVYNTIEFLANEHRQYLKNEGDPALNEFLNDILYKLIKRSLKGEFLNE